MNEGLKYLMKNDLNIELDHLIIKHLKLSKEYDGTKCNKCGFIQGTEYKGVKKSYCEHLTKKVDKKLKKEKINITKRIFIFSFLSDSQRVV